MKFCKRKGFNHLLRIYEQITEEKIHNSFNLKCFGLLAKILTIFLTKYINFFNNISVNYIDKFIEFNDKFNEFIE